VASVPASVERPAGAGGRPEIVRRILDAALALYLERGIRDTALSAVAHRAGVSRPTVYKHVGDVAALARTVVDRELDGFFGRLGARLAADGPASDRLVDALDLAVAHARGHPLLQRLLELEPGAILPVFTVDAEPVLRRAVAALAPTVAEAGADDGADPARPGSAELRAELLARVAISLVLTPAVSPDLGDRDTLRSVVLASLRVGADPRSSAPSRT
jgi:AcrR family transcriptional regulator